VAAGVAGHDPAREVDGGGTAHPTEHANQSASWDVQHAKFIARAIAHGQCNFCIARVAAVDPAKPLYWPLPKIGASSFCGGAFACSA
jgi:hypothetical protein